MEAIIDTKNDYPLAARNTILLKAGHLVRKLYQVNGEKNIITYLTYIKMQNEVGLSAVKVTSDPDIRSIDPSKRNCYFDDEHPANKPLNAYQKYSQVK